jgi:hypothetical protein
MTGCPCGGTCVCHTGGAYRPACNVEGGCGSIASPEPRQVQGGYTRPLPEAVGALLDPQTRKVLIETRDHADGGLHLDAREVTIRPVYAELVAAATPSGQAGGGGRGGGLPVSLEALDLLDRIRGLTADWAWQAGLTPAAEGGVRHAGPPPDPCPRMLRQLAVHGWDDDQAPRMLSRIVERLTTQTVAFLAGDETSSYVRDTRCPRCGAWDVQEWSDDHGAPLRHPALHVVRRDGRVQGTQCTACTTWWEWDGLGEDGPLAQELAADAGTWRETPQATTLGQRCSCRSAASGCRCLRHADGPDGLCSDCRSSPRCGERRRWLAERQTEAC